MTSREENARLTYGEVNDEILGALAPPRRAYFVVMAILAAGITTFLSVWIYQVHTGMVVTGYNHPVGWAFYIVNFVFWIGIGHAGTLISAILHLVRSKWRAAVSRSAEAMTVFAVMMAGLFPLIDMGRVWVFYYLLPYPSERQLWPNFMSPLVWDVVAVSTYFTVSVIFFYVGLIPDLASARDRCEVTLGDGHPRTRLYRWLALGWSGSADQWRHYGRGYLFFAALATPLVVSVHSCVSWDFAMSLLPGWHTTIYAPYFVAGAIHSGLAMVLVLVIPLRRALRLERVITVDHLGKVALTMIATASIVGYAYVLEPFVAWYSGDIFERQFAAWRATGPIAWVYWLLVPLNVLFPLAFVFKKVRRSLWALFAIGVLATAGMWFERLQIVLASTWHDFLPHNWGPYSPRWVELTITAGVFMFFTFLFLAFAKALPTVSASEVKQVAAEDETDEMYVVPPVDSKGRVSYAKSGVVGVFGSAKALLGALEKTGKSRFKSIETFAPVKVGMLSKVLGLQTSPVRYWALGGALAGLAGGFTLAIYAASVNSLYVGGKDPISIVPYCVVGFEGTILLGAIANLAGVIVHARLGRRGLPAAYDRRFSRDKFGLFIACETGEIDEAKAVLRAAGPEEMNVVG